MIKTNKHIPVIIKDNIDNNKGNIPISPPGKLDVPKYKLTRTTFAIPIKM